MLRFHRPAWRLGKEWNSTEDNSGLWRVAWRSYKFGKPCHKILNLGMVGIPPIKMVMAWGWFLGFTTLSLNASPKLS